jgi:hypothetical protein
MQVIAWTFALLGEIAKKVLPFSGWIVMVFLLAALGKVFKLNIKI